MTALAPRPDWMGAAQALVRGCCSLGEGDARVRWLEQVCLALGDQLYPAFLRVLCIVGEHGEARAQQAVAATLAEAMASARLPAGRQAAWGAVGGAALRRQGPIEFLCAWYLHPPGADALSASAFDRSARALLTLVAHDARAHALYRARLAAAADDPLEGAWTRRERAALQALTSRWTDASPAAAEAAVDALLRTAQGHAPAARTAGGAPAPAWAGPSHWG